MVQLASFRFDYSIRWFDNGLMLEAAKRWIKSLLFIEKIHKAIF